MELSIESSYQYVTWKVREFFELTSEIGYSLNSPEFRFAGDSYYLRLYPEESRGDEDAAQTVIKLVRLTSTFPERNVSCKVGYRWRDKKGSEVEMYWSSLANKFNLILSSLQKVSDRFLPDGAFTVVCSMCLKEQSSAGSQQSEEAKNSDTKDKQKGLLGHSVFFLSRSWSSKMELSVESPCQNVKWKVSDFFQLLSKTGYSLNSPEFRFAGDRYCLRFYPKGNRNGDTVDTDLQLVRLTSTFPERIVLYKVGSTWRSVSGGERDIYVCSGKLVGDYGFCLSRSIIEGGNIIIQNGTLTVLCSMRLTEQSSAGYPQSEETGNSYAEEKQEGLPGKVDFVPDADPSCAFQIDLPDTVIGKASKNEDWSSLDTKGVVLLSERMKELLIKGIEQDLKICVQNKEFRAHRNILSARSPVFAMMLAHDTKENNTSTINIEDCDPESFDEFLLYVYSGRTENLTPSNARQLYYTADKYDFPVLKERCVNMLKTSLSVSSICDVVLLAAKHQEKELLEVATEFFSQNAKEILVTADWLNFMSQNPVEANELYIKSMDTQLLRK